MSSKFWLNSSDTINLQHMHNYVLTYIDWVLVTVLRVPPTELPSASPGGRYEIPSLDRECLVIII